jgi:hypothetical protein
MEPFATYRDHILQLAYEREQAKDYWQQRLYNADAETLEGYIVFGGGAEAPKDEPENINLKF